MQKKVDHDHTEPMFLFEHGINMLTQSHKISQDFVFGRDQEIQHITDILSRTTQNNPLLIGDMGVGKTSTVTGFVQKILKKNVPFFMQKFQIYRLNTNIFLENENLHHQLDSHFKEIVSEILNFSDHIILLVDQIYSDRGKKINRSLSFFKQALANEKVRFIVEATRSEYKQFFEKDPFFSKKFEKVNILEPSTQEAINMVRMNVNRIQNHHQMTILNEALEASVFLSQKFLPEKRLPYKAISVLDAACSQVSLSQCIVPHQMTALMREKRILELEKDMLAQEHYLEHENKIYTEKIEKIEAKIQKLFVEYQVLNQEWQHQNRVVKRIEDIKKILQSHDITDDKKQTLRHEIQNLQKKINEKQITQYEVNYHSVAKVISDLASVSLDTILSQNKGWTKDDLVKRLQNFIVGQDHALNRIAQTITQHHLGLGNKEKPIGVFFLFGPHGVGKTETAHALVNVLMGHSRHLISLHMNEFQEAHAIATLKGAPPGYLGYGKGGTLAEAVRQNPHSIILMDEVDNAHPDVLNFFCHIFEKGVLEDCEGVEIDFKNTFFILTSTDCAKMISEKCATLKATEDLGVVLQNLSHKITKELDENYGASFVSRTITIPYLTLQSKDISKIIEMKLRAIEKNLLSAHQFSFEDIGFDYQASVNDFIDIKNNARSIENYIANHALPEITNLLRQRYEEVG